MGANLFLAVIFGAVLLQSQIASGKPYIGKPVEANPVEAEGVPTSTIPAAVSAAAAEVNLPAKVEQEADDAHREKRQDFKSLNGARLVAQQADDDDITDRLQRVITDLLSTVKDLVEISHSQLNSHVASKLDGATGPSRSWPIVLSQSPGWAKR